MYYKEVYESKFIPKLNIILTKLGSKEFTWNSWNNFKNQILNPTLILSFKIRSFVVAISNVHILWIQNTSNFYFVYVVLRNKSACCLILAL